MIQGSLQLHHVVIFVFFFFVFNVFLLSYMTGAFGVGYVSQATSALLSRIAEHRPPARQLPPWERPHNEKHLSKPSVEQGVTIIESECDLGFWESRAQGVAFCKRSRHREVWLELSSTHHVVREYMEVWFRPSLSEAAMYDVRSTRMVILKQGVAFVGLGSDSNEALRRVFDTVLAKSGTFKIGQAASDGDPQEGHHPSAFKGVAKDDQIQKNADADEDNEQEDEDDDDDDDEDEDEDDNDTEDSDAENKDAALNVIVTDSSKECAKYWDNSGDIAYCEYIKEPGVWYEIDSSGQAKFKFKELYRKDEVGEVAIFDESRLIAITLLRRYGLISYPTSADKAIEAATETDQIFLAGGGWKHEKSFKKIPPQVSSNAKDEATVMILVSSYRDVLCSNTLREAFDNAYNPSRVRIGVVNQANPGDMDCLNDYCKDVGEDKCRRSQVTQITLPLDRSRGVMFARFLQQTLIKNEDFCLQVDSHMVFPTNWDRVAIEDWLSADNEMAVMTTYPNRAKDRNDQSYSPVRCNTVWGSSVVACGTSAHNIKHKQQTPHLTAFFGAGIAFSKCHANFVVPYDPYMAFLFKGEEYNRSARLWTHGYDLYAPKKNYAYHFYDDDPRPDKYKNVRRDRSFFGQSTDSSVLVRQSEFRWQAIMGMLGPRGVPREKERAARLRTQDRGLRDILLVDTDIFALGTRRSLREYAVFSGINLIQHTTKDLCDQIGRMPWVPWNTSEYVPLGKGCSSGSGRECCQTALDRAMDKSRFLAKYISQTSDEWAALVKNSPVVSANRSDLLSGPLVETRGWSWPASRTC